MICQINPSVYISACKTIPNDVFDYVTQRCHKRPKCVVSSSFCGGYIYIKHACGKILI